MKKEWRTLTAVVAVALVSVAAWSGYRYMQASAPATRLHTTIVPKDAEVYFRLPGEGGRIDMIGMQARSLGAAGRPLSDLLSAFPAWKVREATAGEVVLGPRRGSDPVFLGIKNGVVAIYFGSPKDGIVQEITGIPADTLMNEDQKRLEKGVGVKNLAGAWRLLEGLQG